MKKAIYFGVIAFGFMFSVNAAEWNPSDLNSCPIQSSTDNMDSGNTQPEGNELPSDVKID